MNEDMENKAFDGIGQIKFDSIGHCSNVFTKALDNYMEKINNNYNDYYGYVSTNPKNISMVNFLIHPTPKLIKQNDLTTIVFWDDGTKTTVTMCEEDIRDNVVNSIYTAFCIAFAKKCFGNNSTLHRIVDGCNEELIMEKNEKLKKEEQARTAEIQKKNHDRKIKKMVKRMKELNEAMEYLAEEELKNGKQEKNMKNQRTNKSFDDELEDLIKELFGGKK